MGGRRDPIVLGGAAGLLALALVCAVQAWHWVGTPFAGFLLLENRVIASAQLGKTPRAIAITPDGRFAWVTHSTPDVSVVDLSRLGS